MTDARPASGVAALAAQYGDVHALPVSFAQRRFWVLDQLDEATAAYTIPVVLELTGTLDPTAFARAIGHVVARHESLRTVFVLEGDEPVQVVLPPSAVPVPVEDLRALDDPAREARVRAAVDETANRGFDLARGPLARFALLRTADDTHVWLAAFHHIVADGQSIGIFTSELEQAYAALLTGCEPALAPLPLQYADYAVWQRKAMQGRGAARQLAYWKTALTQLPTLEIATDHPRPAVATAAGGKREAVIPASVAVAVRALAKREGATPYATFLAAFAVLLHRYTAQDDLVIGSITAGRLRPEVEPLIGLFVNTLAIRAEVNASDPFTAVLHRVRDRTLEALANQEVPFEQVVDAVQPARDRSRSPIFQVAFQLLEGLSRDLQLTGMRASRVSGAKGTSKFDLTLMLGAAPAGAMRAVMEYRSDIFETGTVDRMLGHFGVLLAAIAQDASRSVGSLPLMDAAELAFVTDQGTDAATPIPAWTAPERVHAMAVAHPGVVAVQAEDAVLTYAELDARAARLAALLAAAGVRAGDRVAVMVARSSTLPVALLGAWYAGAAYVPLDAGYPAARIMQVLEDASVAAIVVDADARVEAAEVLANASAPVVELSISTWTGGDAPAAPVTWSGLDALAYVIFTSGSTGRPKGVAVPHRALTNFLATMAERPGLSAGDALVAVTTIAFDIAGLELWMPLTTGARMVLASRATAMDGVALRVLLDATVRATRPRRTMLQATPATWRLLLAAEWVGDPTVCMLCGGEGWPDGLAAALLPKGGALWNVYGPTETTIWSARYLVRTPELSLGEPLANTTLHVLDPRGALVPIGVPGEVWIGGAGLAVGYLGRDDLTAERFVTHPSLGRIYRTGDRVRRLADGRLVYMGRLDDQVKVRGFRIELGEIEAVLAASPAVAQAVAAVASGADGNDARVVAYVVLASPADNSAGVLADLEMRARRALPEYMVPTHIMTLDTFPRTPNGKVDRRALPTPSLDALRDAHEFVAPEGALENQVAGVWEAVLGVERVGRDDDFFALGGNSLSAMRIIARLMDLSAERLTIGALFEARTVAALVTRIGQRRGAALVAEADDLAELLAELEGMSEAEVARQLTGHREEPA